MKMTDIPRAYFWEGKNVEDCNREELLECIRFLAESPYSWHHRFSPRIFTQGVNTVDPLQAR